MSNLCGVLSEPKWPKHPRDEYIDWNELELFVDSLIDETKELCSIFYRQTTGFTDSEKFIVKNVLQLENCHRLLCQIYKLHAQTETEMELLTLEINYVQELVNCLESKPNEILNECRDPNEHDCIYNNLINLSTKMSHLELDIDRLISEKPARPELIRFFYNITKYLSLTLEALENTEKNIYIMQSKTENIENLLRAMPTNHCTTVKQINTK